VANGMRRHGVLLNFLGKHYNVLKMRPPMVFSRDNVDQMIAALDAVLAQTPPPDLPASTGTAPTGAIRS